MTAHIDTREVANLNELLPRQLRDDNRLFINLLEDYYRFLNQEKNPSYVINRIIDEHNLDKTFDPDYLTKIKAEIAKASPTNRYLQKTFLLKRIIDVYNLRGNEESIKYFFRVFFNEEAQIYYPWERVIKPSQGNWTTSHKLKLILLYGRGEDLLLKEIEQINSLGTVLAKGTVSKVEQFSYLGLTYFLVDLQESTILGEFNQYNFIQTLDKSVFGKVVKSFNDIVITSPGEKYQIGDKIYLNHINESFTAYVDKVGANGEILSITIDNYGFASSLKYFDYIPLGYNISIPMLSDVYLEGEINFINNKWYIEIQNQQFFEIIPSTVLTSRFMPEDTSSGQKKKYVALHGHMTTLGIQLHNIELKDKNRFMLYDFERVSMNHWLNHYTNPDLTHTIRSLSYTIQTQNDEANGANLKFVFSSIFTTKGHYISDHGKPSGYGVLQDSFYYQVFSYEINASAQVSEWRKQLDEFVHPAGLKGFGLLNLQAKEELIENIATALDIDETFMFPYIASFENIAITSYINASTQSYNGNPNDLGPYFLEDYAAGASFFYTINFENFVFHLDGKILQFSVGSRTNMGSHTQGENTTLSTLLIDGRDKYNYNEDFSQHTINKINYA